ncbi:hypothetical protein BV898_12096 [Hypsibius exemplaris]|uniref:Uncharacterized protein n=1 Tax=Hypsibius exemplaris TaxID=2072580 RepID=A0A1W0WEU4_HYPEX|nr:hypothetical protein BV898_12096 [Hypsibius exemplaris]
MAETERDWIKFGKSKNSTYAGRVPHTKSLSNILAMFSCCFGPPLLGNHFNAGGLRSNYIRTSRVTR